MTTLAEFMILSGGDNRPPMLDKDLYDSWKSRMELSMENREHEKIQADCDVKATNIILQVLSSDVYALEIDCKLKFVTDVKLVRDLHTTNFDQLHAYLQQHELHANEVCIMLECNHDPLALVANHQQTPSHFNTYQSSYNNPQFQQQFSPSPFPQYGSNHPTQHYSTTYPSTPLVITYSSAPYLNAYSSTVHKDACPQPQSIPQIEYTVSIGRQSSFASGTFETRANILETRGNNSGQQRVVKCFNCQGEGYMARQFPKPKRKRDAIWFRDKVLLVKAQGSGKVLNEEELTFLADPGVAKGPVTQTVIKHADDLDTYDSDCDKISTAKVVLMANLSSYGSDVLSKVPNFENTHNDMLNQSVQEMPYFEQTRLVTYPETEITITNCNKVNKDNLIANESLSTKLERYKERVKLLEERPNVDLSTREKLIIDDIIRDKKAQFADFEKEINSLKQTLSEQLKE
ncbi:hypothetical protein Tco_0679124 [Tanacetum coccineum]|uniref:Integrase, catalytic region, zinc finger, CCHC-type, peptidase aspartic, catalytic n=1 Tax=Tanacetum coccineum TaxID=301880 RepID=A0ABQ4XGY3_9ASTR